MPAAGTPAPAVTAPVPPEAVTAGMVEAAQAYDLAHRSNYVSWTRPPDYQVARLITGAAGLIREDERERCHDGLRDAIRRVEHLAASAQELAVRTAVAAERERIRQLAIRYDVEYADDGEVWCDDDCHKLWKPFAGLLSVSAAHDGEPGGDHD